MNHFANVFKENFPVAYACKAVTETETRYAQIEKEALAIVFGCNRFHQYIYGKKVVVETDHKPLEVIFKKPINECPMRVQRMRLATQKYDLEVRYKPGKELLLADALSRKFLKDENNETDCDIGQYVNSIMNNFPISLEKKELFINETAKDKELQMLISYINKGWPNCKKQVPDIIKVYFGISHELSVIEGLVFKNNKLIVPKSLRKEMLNLIHYNHLGIEKCKLRAREILYWPGMCKEIEDLVSSCKICNMYKKDKVKEPLMPREVPDRPWQMIGIDLFHFKNAEHILIVDYFSKYVEIAKLQNTDSASVINVLKLTFSRLGVPEIVCSDNGPQLYCNEFSKFAKDWNFKHETSSPYWPRSNGMSERHIQTIKMILKKVETDGKCPHLALLEYRNTPIDNEIKSPNEIMFGLKVRGIIPVRNIVQNNIDLKGIRNSLLNKQEKQKMYYDRNSHTAKPVNVNQKVFVKKEMNRPLVPGKIIEKCDRPRSYRIELDNGRQIERNTRHIHPCKTRHFYNGRFNNNNNGQLEPYQFVDDYDNVSVKDDNNVNKNLTQDQNNENVNQQEAVDIEIQNNRNVTQTRSGRIVKTPAHLKDYVCK